MARSVDGARSRGRVALTLVVAATVTLATATLSSATYTGATDATAGFGSAACYYRASVQSGTAVSTTDGATTATIAAVDPSRAFLMFSTRHDSNRPVAISIGGRIASATTLEFVRDTDEASPVAMTIEWSVVEYPCGVSVQRGSVMQTAATLDVALTPVASTAQAFVLWSKNVHAPDQSWDQNDPVIGDLTSVSNLQFRATAANVNHTIWWQVVEFTDASMIRVQRGSTSLTGGALSVDVTLPVAVDQERSFVLVDTVQPGVIDLASVMVRGRVSSSSIVALDRSAGTYDVPEIGWQVVELLDGSAVTAGFLSVSSASTGITALLDAVELARTTAFASTQTGGGQNGGRTTYTTDDTVGVAAFAFRFASATHLEVRRDVTHASGSSADVAWFAVSWGLA